MDRSIYKLQDNFKKKISPSFLAKYEKQLILMRNVTFKNKIRELYENFKNNEEEIFLNMNEFNIFRDFLINLMDNKSLLKLNCSGVTMNSLMLSKLMQTIETISLQELNLSNMNISSLALKFIFKTLKQNKKLNSLNLFNVTIFNENVRDLAELIHANSTLKEINFNFCNMDSETIKEVIEIITKSPHLQTLNFSKQNFSTNGFRALSYLLANLKNTRIKNLDLSYNKITSDDLKTITISIPKYLNLAKILNLLPKIECLNLAANKFNNEIGCNLLNYIILRIKDLKTINFSKNRFTHEHLKLLEPSIANINYELNFSRNLLGDQMAELKFLEKLKIINFSYNNLHGKSIDCIAKCLYNNYDWESLNLSHNLIDDIDFDRLITGLSKNSKLSSLNIKSNNIKSFEKFSKNFDKFSLQSLNISDNPIEIESLCFLFVSSKVFESKLTHLKMDDIGFNIHQQKDKDFNTRNTEMLKLTSLSLTRSHKICNKVLKSLSNKNNLTELILDRCICSQHAFEQMNVIILNSKVLEHLSLAQTNLGHLFEREIDRYFSIIESISKSKSIKKLNLSGNHLGRYPKKNIIGKVFQALGKLESLENLNIGRNDIENEVCEEIDNFMKNSPKLTEIDFSNNPIGFIFIDKLAEVLKEQTNLKVLKLSNTLINLDCLAPLGCLLSFNSTIEELDISNNNLLEKNVISLITNQKNVKLNKFFVLHNSKIDNHQFSVLSSFFSHNSIFELIDLQGSKLSEENINILIQSLSQIPNLKQLNLSRLPLLDCDLAELFNKFRNNKTLHTLILRNSTIWEKSIFEIKSYLKEENNLQHLDFSEISIPISFFQNLSEELKKIKTLKILKLNKCDINKEHMDFISEIIAVNANLEELHLSENKIVFEDIKKFFEKLKSERKALKKLDLSKNAIFKQETKTNSFLTETCPYLSIEEVDLTATCRFFNYLSRLDFVKDLSNGLSLVKNLRILVLSNNNLNDDFMIFLKNILTNVSLEELYLKNNEFTVIGLKYFFQALETNQSLSFLDISGCVKSSNYEVILAELLENTFTKNKDLKFLNISENQLSTGYNQFFNNIFKANDKIFFINDNWKGIKNETAIFIVDRLIKIYSSLSNMRNVPSYVKKLNFSQGELNDEFCIHFSNVIENLKYLEEFDFSENPKITLIGLKYLYVNLVHNKNKLKFKKFFFKTYDHRNIFNDGIASSIVQWARYSKSFNRLSRFFKKGFYIIFSLLIVKANRFQYGSAFQKFSKKFDFRIISIFYSVNYIVCLFLTLYLPLKFSVDCQKGLEWVAHVIFSIFILVTFVIEFVFWVVSKKTLDPSIDEKDLQKTVFISDAINLFAGILARSDSYLDMCFIMAASQCNDAKIMFAGVAVLILKLILRTKLFLSAILKLEKARKNDNEIRALNLIAKIANICDYLLIGDIMDRFCPGNAKKIKRIFFTTLNEHIYMNIIFTLALLKLITEDFPQTLLQILFVWVRSNSLSSSFTRSMIIFQIAKNAFSILISLLTVTSLRPSFIEQSDFDEKIEDIKVIMNSPKDANALHTERTSILKIKINKSSDFNNKLLEMRSSLKNFKKKMLMIEEINVDDVHLKNMTNSITIGDFVEEGIINLVDLEKKGEGNKYKYDFSFNQSDLDYSGRNILENSNLA